MPITVAQALAFRLRRQLLEPIGSEPVDDVVRRLGAVQSGDGFATELAVRTRQRRSQAGEVAAALRDGRIIKSFAFRGATHLMTPGAAGTYLALRASARTWELPSWRTYYRLEPSDWPALREVARGALADGPLTVRELVAAIAAPRRFRHLGGILEGNPWGVVKVLAWHGDLCFGPLRGRQPTLQRLDRNVRWPGIPDVDEAGRRAIETYLAAYGPATPEHLKYWLGGGLGAGGKRIKGWLGALGDRITDVDVDGTPSLVLADDTRDLSAARPSTAVRLLPAYDQWVLGPGTADERIVPSARRALVSRGAHIVITGGVVSGTWSMTGETVFVEWFEEAGAPPRAGIDEEVVRLAAILDRGLKASVQIA